MKLKTELKQEDDRSCFVVLHTLPQRFWTYQTVSYGSKSANSWSMRLFQTCQTQFLYTDKKGLVISQQFMIYAKGNGAQMVTFAATGTMVDIDDLRRQWWAWERG